MRIYVLSVFEVELFISMTFFEAGKLRWASALRELRSTAKAETFALQREPLYISLLPPAAASPFIAQITGVPEHAETQELTKFTSTAFLDTEPHRQCRNVRI